ncbi:MAG TPA: DNA polymerase [Ktedonobacteraceae bacterium]|nr:DNA polymerase [Ktedonobacteraceae bacterium]
MYAEDHRLRLIALATPKEAWVFPYETFGLAINLVPLLQSKLLIMHNASYDVQVLDHHIGGGIENWWRQTRDTKILAHQIDPRGRDEGGIGQSLEELVKYYIPQYAKLGDDLKDEFKRLKQSGAIRKSATFADMWRELPIDNELYNIYAGTDAILTARLFQDFREKVDINSDLTKMDHKVAMIATKMDAKGFALDEEYTTKLRDELLLEEADWKEVAKGWGLENINSPQQVADTLFKYGIVPTDKTPKGNPKVDKNFLKAHEDHQLVTAIIEGKKAGKWRTTWVEKFLQSTDASGRVHPSTNTLRARTARFSITGIPAQTLPAKDSLVRSCFVADTGECIVGVDYSNQELRFAAAMAPDARMIRAFRTGENLHEITASVAFPGMDVHKGTPYYDLGKMGNFAVGYGAGVSGLVRQGMTQQQAVAVRNGIKKAYRGMAALSDRLKAEAGRKGYITTWTGRRLPVDADREYAAFNYYIQSGCRDITARAMIRLYDAGFVDNMRLAIHDEILFSLPNDAEMIREIVGLMSTKVGTLDLPAEAKIGSRSWGSLYDKA